MKKFLMLFIAMSLLCFSSCTPRTEEEKAKIATEMATDRFNQVQSQLPYGATDVKDIGNGWCTFSLQNRQFMFRYRISSTSKRGYESSAIVELNPK